MIHELLIMQRYLIFFLCFGYINYCTQEINAKVRVDTKRINQDNGMFFKNLEQKIANLLN